MRAQSALPRSARLPERAQVLNTTVVTHIPLGERYGDRRCAAMFDTLRAPPPVTVFWGLTKR
jgi:hypothetical protein